MQIRGWLFPGVLALALLITAGCLFSPWPGSLAVRALFDWGTSRSLPQQLALAPAGVIVHAGIVHAAKDPDGVLDLYLPPADGRHPGPRPVLVWVHGGGFVSGDSRQIAPYARWLADAGYAVVAVNYTKAPEARHPTPARQVNQALRWLDAAATRYPVDPGRVVLAGDSAGASIAAQVANAITSPDYALALGLTPALAPERLKAVILHCGPYDLAAFRLDGVVGAFLRSVLHGYSGRREGWQEDPAFRPFSVVNFLTSAFPPAFVSVGNADPLEPQSRALASTLQALGVPVQTRFHAPDAPALAHEYQFEMQRPEARRAFTETLAFLGRYSAAPAPAPLTAD